MGRIRKALARGISLLEETVTRIGDPYSGTALLETLRKSRDRGAELALENAQLHDEIETMRKRMNDLIDNGPAPTLYNDEVAALKVAIDVMEHESVGNPAVLDRLLVRANHSRLTERQWEESMHAVVMGRTFEPELSPSDDIERPEEAPYCDCDAGFRTAEDWRDHMNAAGPCDGSKKR